MTRFILSLLLMMLAVSSCMVDGGYGGRGYGGRGYGNGGWSEHGGERDHEEGARYRNWNR